MNLRPLGYEPTDVRLRCPGQSLVTALTSADLRREVVPGLLHLSRLPLCLSRCVQFTNRFTEPVLDLWLSALPRARTRALRPVGSPRHRRPPARGAGQNRRFSRAYVTPCLAALLPGAFSGRAHHATQGHPAYIPHDLNCSWRLPRLLDPFITVRVVVD